jgi:hypothetical protein
MRSTFVKTVAAALVAVAATVAATLATGVTPVAAQSSPSDLLPIVFVHGQSGSAQQFETQAMRFTSNGYPDDLLFAFEYDTSQPGSPLTDLDAFIDDVLEQTGADDVYAIGHSRGTFVWTSYLSDPGLDGPDKVAKYVNVEGVSLPTLPGGVPTIGIWGEWNTAGSGYNRRGDTDAQIGPDPAANFYFGDKSHTETMTSAEAFDVMYDYLVGEPPATTDVIAEPPGRVSISGRAVLFPENDGYAGASVEVWRVDPATGQRIGVRPRASFAVDETGEFGPVAINGTKHYELALVRPEDGSVHHFYFEPFTRSDHFVRLNAAKPGTGLELFTPKSDETTNMVVVRQRELWGDQGASSDVLTIGGTNVLTPLTSPRQSSNLALFAQDDGLDGVTSLEKGVLFPFDFIGFITAADVATPASPGGAGTVELTETPRGTGRTATLNVPNWPSTTDRITVQFRDTDQVSEAFTDPG